MDSQGNELVCDTVSNYENHENAAYLDVVVSEAVEVFATQFTLTTEEAKSQLLKNNYTIYTNFDKQISKTLNESCAQYDSKANIGGAITNLEGDLLAVASICKNGSDDENLSLQKSQPCSTFKPLAVYAPAIENATINWSSLFNDSPYSKIKGEDGKLKDWPSNSTGTYSNQDVTISKAISKSLNTVAVKCLSKYGVNRSISFLENGFGITLDYEKKQSEALGNDEVIGNIALGSTSQGFSTIDMAGYYQIFANGGSYTAPKAIKKIVDNNKNIVYENIKQKKQIISNQTAKIMNELLQKVVTDPEGTGVKALCENVSVAGKTGTGNHNSDNWFVGVTPQYSCAIWHSKSQKNTSAEIFSSVFKNIKHENSSFPDAKNVYKKIYCLESGLLAGVNCHTFDMGYYTYNATVSYCNKHN